MAEAEAISVECGFCCRHDEDMEKPVTLPCTHVHCLGCLTACFEINHMTACPVQNCGEAVVVPLDTLPTYKLDNMPSCDVCIDGGLGTQPAVIYCNTCEKRCCSKHEEHHDTFLTNHEKVNISEYGVQHKRLFSKDCVKHRDEPYTMGCKVCLSLSCVKCLSGIGSCADGSPHELTSLVELVAAVVEDDVKVQIVAKEEKLEKLFKLTSQVSSDYETKTRELLQMLRDTRDEQPSVIKQKYDKLEEELLKKRQEKKNEIAEYLEGKVLTMWAQLKNQRLRIETILKRSHPVDTVKAFSELKVEIQRLLDEELPKLELTDLVELNEKGESRDVELKIVSANDMIIESELGCIGPVPLPKSMEHWQVVQLPAMPFSVYYYKGSTYIGLDNDGGIVRVDSVSRVCQPFISCSGVVGSVIVHRDRAYTLLYSQPGPPILGVYDMSGSQITQWNVSCDDGNAMAIVSDQLVIADQPNKRITVYSLTGQVLRHVPCTLLGDDFVCICAADDSSVIVTDGNSSNVSRVNINTGDVMWSTSVDSPCGVCCYGTQYVLVGRYSSEYIQILDCKTGHLLSELTNDTVTGGLMYGLHIFGSTLVVADCVYQLVQFHQLS